MDWKQIVQDLQGRGWTQQLIAETLGASQASISELRNGKTTNPTYKLGRGIEALHKSGAKPKGRK